MQIKAACRQKNKKKKERAAKWEKKWQQEELGTAGSPRGDTAGYMEFAFVCTTLCPRCMTPTLQKATTTEVRTQWHGGMGCLLHMLPPEKRKESENKSSFFHIRHRTKKPHSRTQGENEFFLALADASREYGDSSTWSMTENSTVVQNQLLILTFILIQFAEETWVWLLWGLMAGGTGL